MLVATPSDENGICYIDTQNLDGETNLKERHYPRGLKLPTGSEFRWIYSQRKSELTITGTVPVLVRK
jgi:hypothetical protein